MKQSGALAQLSVYFKKKEKEFDGTTL